MTSTTINNNYTTNSIIKDWLTLKGKLSIDKEFSEKIDFEKYDITVEY